MNDYAQVADNSSLDLGTGSLDDFTLESFINVQDASVPGIQTLLYKQNAYALYFNENGLFFRVWSTAVSSDFLTIGSTQSLSSGWHHVAAVFDNENTSGQDLLALYLDGSRVASFTARDWTPGINNSTSPLYLGSFAGVNPFRGWMEETRLSNTVRYSGDIYTVPTDPFLTDGSTRALWHFNEAAGSTSFSDATTNGNTLTGFNGAQAGVAPPLSSVTYTVTSASDSGTGSLREAIGLANAHPGLDEIRFQIGTGAQTINVLTSLPIIADPVIIDATTQPGFVGQPIIELNGSQAAAGSGLTIMAGSSTVRGLVIGAFPVHGISLQENGGNRIEGNYIGIDRTGSIDRGNGFDGISIVSTSQNTIGGTSTAKRNVISGNGGSGIRISGGFMGRPFGTVIQGNYIGTDATGTAALGNGSTGIDGSSSDGGTIGGTTPGARNVIAANSTAGVRLASSNGWTIQGNYFGTDATGSTVLATPTVLVTQHSAIFLMTCQDTLVGGTSTTAGNVISAGPGTAETMNWDGIVLTNTTTRTQIQGNYIGTNATGTALVGRGRFGINVVGPDNVVGGSLPGARNIIGGFRYGINIVGSFVGNSSIQGNYIGTDATGTVALPNDLGINASGTGLVIGGTDPAAGNLISGNSEFGIVAGPDGVRIQGNYIGTNAAGSAALPNGTGISLGGDHHTVGGSTAGAGNLVSGNRADGIVVGVTGSVIQGNRIGTNSAGTASIGNGGAGILVVAGSNQIGGTTVGAGNLISGNLVGVKIDGGGSLGVPVSAYIVQGNLIGTTADGTAALGNTSHGIWITGNVWSNVIGGTAGGARNVIAYNGGDGVFVDSGSANIIRGNSIYANTGLGVDLGANGVTPNDAGDADFGANDLLNFPVLTAASSSGGSTSVSGTLNSTGSTTFTLDFYASDASDPTGNGEGRTYLGSTTVTTDAAGNVGFTAILPVGSTAGSPISATTTDPGGSTSEFSAQLLVPGSDTTAPTVTSIARLTPSSQLTNVASVVYRVTFSEHVNNVSAADFTLVDVSGTLTGESITSVSVSSGTTIDVTVNTGSAGAGDLRLDVVVPGATITDAAGNALAAGFAAGQVYTVDHAAPAVSSIVRLNPTGQVTNAASVVYRVTFSEPVVNVSAADFTLVDVSNSITGESITSVSASSGTTFDVTVSTGTAGDGNLRLDMMVPGATIQDNAGNALMVGFTAGQVYTIDRIPPTIAGFSPSLAGGTLAVGTTSLQVTFSEPVLGGGTSANYQLLGLGPDALLGTADDAVVPLSVTYSGSTATLSFSALTPSVYRLTVQETITGGSGIPLDGDGDGQAGGNRVTDFVALEKGTSLFDSTPSFASGSTSTAGLAVGDFNGDGRQDLVAGSGNAGAVAVLLGRVDGTFADPLPFGTASGGLSSVAVSDFNGDGRQDIAAGHNSGVAILLGRGDGTFNPAANYGGLARSVAVGDYNGDGRPDLAVANSLNNSIGTLLNNGDGTFRAGTSFPVSGDWPRSVTAGDFDGDLRSDLVMTYGSSITVGLALGNGDGTFGSIVKYDTNGSGLRSVAVAVGDFDGDGRQDLAVTHGSSGASGVSSTVAVLLGRSGGGFASAVNYAVGMSLTTSVAVGDFDGDGRPDIAVATGYERCVRLLRGLGGGTFALDAQVFAAGGSADLLAAGDFNGDGRRDLAAAINTFSEGKVALMQGRGDGTFAAVTGYGTTGSNAVSVAVSDFDGDGRQDIVVANRESSDPSTAAVLLGLGGGSFAPPTTYSTGGSYASSVVVGDFNGDGHGDLALNNISGNLGVLLGRGDGTFASAVTYSYGGYNSPSMAVGDVDGDGRQDLVVATDGVDGQRVGVLRGRGDGTFAPVVMYSSGVSYSSSAARVSVADFNGDGRQDVALTPGSSPGNFVSLLLGQANGALSPAVRYAVGADSASPVVAADLNGDGRQDLAVGSWSASELSVLFGRGDGTFAPYIAYSIGESSPSSFASGDFDGDGRLDLVFAGWNVGIMLGQEGGTFAAPVMFVPPGYTVSSVAVGDLDGDGQPDLAEANGASLTVGILRNLSSRGLTQLTGPHGFAFDIQTGGTMGGQLVQGSSNAFDGLNRLQVGGSDYAPTANSARDDGGRTVLTGTQALAGLNVHREVTVPATDNEDFARTVDVFENPTGAAITTTVRIVGNLGSDAATTVFSTSSGDTNLDTADQWIGTDDADGTGSPAIIHAIHGPSGLRPTSVVRTGDNIEWTYALTVPAGQTVRLATFTILAQNRADAIAAANVLVTPAGFGGQAAASLTPAELASLANFDFSPLTVTDVVDVAPDPRNAPVATVDVVLSKPVDLSTFTFADLALTRNGTPVALSGAVTLSLVSGSTYRINGLDQFTAGEGTYVLTVNGVGILALNGNAGSGSASDSWVMDATPPTVNDVVDITPDPRTTSVSTVDVVFSEPIDLSTFTFADLGLTRDGSPVTLNATVTTSFVSGTTYRIGGLDSFTAAAGTYVLAVSAVGIQDPAGNAGTGSASDTVTVVQSAGTLRGTLFEDLNGNGLREPGEASLEGRTVYIDANGNGQADAGEATALTNAAGGYEFTGLAPRTYTVAQVLPVGWRQTAPGGVGPEFRVNTTIADTQLAPATAMAPDGRFVVVWQHASPSTFSRAIMAQRYDASGVPQGPEITVFTLDTAASSNPAVAMDAQGNFVVVWATFGLDGDSYGIFGQRFDAAGVAQGSRFPVNVNGVKDQSNPSIAMDAAGDFVVIWETRVIDGVSTAVSYSGRRFNAAGVPKGGDFLVANATSDGARSSSVAMDASGNFVVAWQDGGPTFRLDIFAQRYDAAGIAQGSVIPVNTTTPDHQARPAVGMDFLGNFVVAWISANQGGNPSGLYARRFSAAGQAFGSEFLVSTAATGSYQAPRVAMDQDGHYVVAWAYRITNLGNSEIYARRYDASGMARGSEFQVNTTTAGLQKEQDVALRRDGALVVVWSSEGQDPNGTQGIYARRLAALDTPTAHTVIVTAGQVIDEVDFGSSKVDSKRPPTLAPIPDQSMAPNPATLVVALPGSDPDGDPLTYTARAQSLTHWLDQSYGLYRDAGGYYTGHRGQQEKYLRGATAAAPGGYADVGGYYYYLLRDGSLYQLQAPVTADLVGVLVARLAPSVYDDPSALWAAQDAPASAAVTVAGNEVTIAPGAGYGGTFVVLVSVSDGFRSASRYFLVSVGAQPPAAGGSPLVLVQPTMAVFGAMPSSLSREDNARPLVAGADPAAPEALGMIDILVEGIRRAVLKPDSPGTSAADERDATSDWSVDASPAPPMTGLSAARVAFPSFAPPERPVMSAIPTVRAVRPRPRGKDDPLRHAGAVSGRSIPFDLAPNGRLAGGPSLVEAALNDLLERGERLGRRAHD